MNRSGDAGHSVRDVGVWAIRVELLILPAVEADLARQIKPMIAVVAPTEHGSGVPAGTTEKKMAGAVGRPFADQQRAARAPANVIEQINVLLSPIPVEVGSADPGS